MAFSQSCAMAEISVSSDVARRLNLCKGLRTFSPSSLPSGCTISDTIPPIASFVLFRHTEGPRRRSGEHVLRCSVHSALLYCSDAYLTVLKYRTLTAVGAPLTSTGFVWLAMGMTKTILSSPFGGWFLVSHLRVKSCEAFSKRSLGFTDLFYVVMILSTSTTSKSTPITQEASRHR